MSLAERIHAHGPTKRGRAQEQVVSCGESLVGAAARAVATPRGEAPFVEPLDDELPDRVGEIERCAPRRFVDAPSEFVELVAIDVRTSRMNECLAQGASIFGKPWSHFISTSQW
jgi:hypothetical protein